MRASRTAVVALLLLAAAAASAQTKKELAARVVVLEQAGIENIGRTIAGRTSQQIWQLAGPALARIPADKRETVGREVQAEIKKFYDEVEPVLRKRALELASSSLSAAYEERFTEDELKQLVAWLESPTSKKQAQFDAEQGSALAERVVKDTGPVLEPKLKALQASVGKRLGLPPPPASAPAAPGASAPRK
jgi:hypothetical protein